MTTRFDNPVAEREHEPRTQREEAGPVVEGRRLQPWAAVTVVALVVIGLAVRVDLVTRGVPLDSDEAVVALIARRFAGGEFYVFFWGQAYGGTIESIILAPFLAVAGASTIVAKTVTGALFAVCSYVVWRIGRRTIGEPSAALAGAIFWAAPAYFVHLSVRPNIYVGTLTASTVTVLFLLQLRDDDASRWWPVGAGLAAGIAFWSSPQSLFLLLPVGVALLPSLLAKWRRLLLSVPFVVMGAAPWLLYNVRNEWKSLDAPQPDFPTPYLDRVGSYFPQLPIALGLREAITERWYFHPVSLVLTGALVVAVAIVALNPRARRPVRLLAAAALLLPFAYAISPMSQFGHPLLPRYLTMSTPLIALLVGRGVAWLGERTHPVVVAVLAVGLAIAAAADAREYRGRIVPTADPDVVIPASSAALVELLEEHDVRYAYAHYWLAFRATWATDESTIVIPIQAHLTRHEPYARAAESSPTPPALLTVTDSVTARTIPQRLDQLGVSYELDHNGRFLLILPDRHVVRADIAGAFAGQI